MKKILINLARTSKDFEVQRLLLERAKTESDIKWALVQNPFLASEIRPRLPEAYQF